MLQRRLAATLLALTLASPGQAQTPLAELTAVAPASFRAGETGLAGFGQTIADALIQDHAADAALQQKLRDTPPTDAMRLGRSSVWLLDGVSGTLGCHTPMLVTVPQGAPAHEIPLPGQPDPASLCGLSALATVSIDGDPALWIEQSGAFANSLGQSRISIAGWRDERFEPPCSVTVYYDISDRASHAFCDGVDCVPLIRQAEVLAMRLRQQETADSLAAGVLLDDEDGADYRRMLVMEQAAKEPAELPTFGVSLDTPYMSFIDQVIFPIRLEDGGVYMARMGHGAFGLRQTADTLLVVYRLQEEKMVPAASVYVSARRVGISLVETK